MKRLYTLPLLLACGVFSLMSTQEAHAACDETGDPGQVNGSSYNYNPGFGAWIFTKARATGDMGDQCEDHITDLAPSAVVTALSKDGSAHTVQNTSTRYNVSIGNYDVPVVSRADGNASINDLSVTAGLYQYGMGAGSTVNTDAEILDVIKINNPNAASGTSLNDIIPVQYCSNFESSSSGVTHATGGAVVMNAFHTYDGGFEHKFYDKFVMSDKTITHSDVGEICEYGYIEFKGRWAHMNFKLSAYTLGKADVDNLIVGYHPIYGTPVTHGSNIRDGSITQTIKFGPLPDGYKCYSKSGKFPGCEPMPDEKICKANNGNNSEGCGCNVATGTKHQTETDYSGGLLSLSRTYRSDASNETGVFGENWRHGFDRNAEIITASDKPTAIVYNDDGSGAAFYKDGSTWESDFGNTSSFEDVMDGATHVGYLHITSNDTREYYDLDGLMTRTEYRGGEALDFTHDGSDRLSTVTNEQGKTLTFSYNGSDQITSVVTPSGTFSYTYDGDDNLATVTRPDSEVRTYHYEDTNFVNALTGITDEENVRFATWGYDTEGRVTSFEKAGNVDSFDIAYNSDGTATTTNSLGKDTIYTFETINGQKLVTNVDGVASANCAAASKSKTYTAEGWLDSKTDWNGNTTTYLHDSNGLETSRTEDAYGSAARTITTTYDSTYRLPDVITETGKTTDYDYDSDGRVTSMTVTDTATSETRTTTKSYYANTTDANGNTVLGKLHKVNGPRTDVTDETTYTYDTSDRLIKVSNALGHETETTSFDSANRPLTTEDANDVETTFVYDSLGRITSSTVASGTASAATTSYTYDDNGNVLTVTLPNGVVTTNTYDDAQRLIGVEDDIGNTITYTLDDAGNITKEEYKNTSATLKYTLSQTYDELSRIIESVDANLDTTAFSYDSNGNQTSVTDGNLNATSFAFDGLNRLVSQTDALSGVTSNDLNELNQNEGTTDPRNNETSYSYNAFGDVTQEVSPDRGTITYTHDKAGNVTSMTDARSVVTNYSYDSINRLTDVEYPSDSSLDVTLIYDSTSGCGASKGRLCSVVDASGTTDYVYDDLGRLTNVTETRGSLSFTTSYSYDAAGVLTGITLPSGRDVDYTLNGNGHVSAVSADVNGFSTTLASSINYLPFGPMSSMTYGNSVSLTNTHNSAYQLTNRQIGSMMNEGYTYDAAGNVTIKGITGYTLDNLYRITGEGSDSYTYDAIGNRTSKNSDTYVYPSTSSKVTSIGGVSLTHDAAGSLTTDTQRTYVIDAAGRVKEVKISGSTVGAYVYDADNLRTKKTASSVVTHYVYGMGGKLYGEYDASGNMLREYVYLNDEPLAQIDDVSSSDVLTYLHTDHQGTPRYATNTSGSQVWAWSSDAFGVGIPTGSATVNLRFPGQYFDDESDLHYNWNRYYDPETGRYISSDPIGLDGGFNTFLYAEANPVMFVDPEGLIAWDASVTLTFASLRGATGVGGHAVFVSRTRAINGCYIGVLVNLNGGGYTRSKSILPDKLLKNFLTLNWLKFDTLIEDRDPLVNTNNLSGFWGLEYVQGMHAVTGNFTLNGNAGRFTVDNNAPIDAAAASVHYSKGLARYKYHRWYDCPCDSNGGNGGYSDLMM